MVPERVKRIDRALAELGIDWTAPFLAALDPGMATPRLTSSELVHASVLAILSGGTGVDYATIGQMARVYAPAGAAAPIAGQVEFQWPGSDEDDIDYPISSEGEFVFGSGRDLREQFAELASSTPMAELREAFALAAGLMTWAEAVCAAVEEEIASGQPGRACQEWAMSAFGITRMLIVQALRDRAAAGPAAIATTALGLIFVRNMLKPLRQLLPHENLDVLRNPVIAPDFLASFLLG